MAQKKSTGLRTVILLNVFFLGCSSERKAPEIEREPASLVEAFSTRPAFDPNKRDYAAHVDHSLRAFEWRYGTSQMSFRTFHQRFIDSKEGPDEAVRSESCIASLSHNTSSRNQFLRCLNQWGARGLNVRLYTAIFKRKSEYLKTHSADLAHHQTVALLQYVEDMIRENLHLNGKPADWFTYEKSGRGSFSAGKHQTYAFKDGDLLLSMGSTSISSLIPNSTWPGRRFSHAFILHMPDGIFRTAEAIIEKGVISSDLEHFSKSSYANIMVQRWKGEKSSEVGAKASAFAYDKVGSKYNIAMDWDDQTRYFCNQLIAKAFSHGSGVDDKKLIPSSTEVVSDSLLAYLNNMGVKKKAMPSPGDFLDSPYFEPVAEFRNSVDLYRAWEMLLLGDVFVERINSGFRVKPRTWFKSAFAFLGAADEALDLAELGFIPDGLNGKSVTYIKTQENEIFAKAWKKAEEFRKGSSEFKERNLKSVPPWILRARLSYAVQEATQDVFAP